MSEHADSRTLDPHAQFSRLTQPTTPAKCNASFGHSYTNSSSGESGSVLFSPWRASSSDKSNCSPVDPMAATEGQGEPSLKRNSHNLFHGDDATFDTLNKDLGLINFTGSGPLDRDVDLDNSEIDWHLRRRENDELSAHRAQLESMRTSAQESFDSWLTSTRQSQRNMPESDTDASARYTQHLAGLGRLSTPALQQEGLPSPRFFDWPQSGLQVSVPPAQIQSAHFEPNALSSSPTSLTGTYVGCEVVEPEYSIFVGDLCPDLLENDLLRQFRRPPSWSPSHPLALAHAHVHNSRGSMYEAFAPSGPAPFGSVKSATIMTDPLTGASRGFGFVRFSSDKDCARALVEMQGIIIEPSSGRGGRPLRVCPATPKNRSTHSSTAAGLGVPNVVLQEKLANAITFEQQRGSLIDADLLAKLSVQALTSTTANMKTLRPANDAINNALNTSSAMDPTNTTVFVGGLSSLISEETLKTFFIPFGEIRYVKIPSGKGCGFVQFANKADAERAIERMQGFPIGGGRIRLSWGRSQGDKAAVQAAQGALGQLGGCTSPQSPLFDINGATTSANLTQVPLSAFADGRSRVDFNNAPSLHHAGHIAPTPQYLQDMTMKHSQSVPSTAHAPVFPGRLNFLPSSSSLADRLRNDTARMPPRYDAEGLYRSHSDHARKPYSSVDLDNHFSNMSMSPTPLSHHSTTNDLFSSSGALGSPFLSHHERVTLKSGSIHTRASRMDQPLSPSFGSFDPFAQNTMSPTPSTHLRGQPATDLGTSGRSAISPPRQADSFRSAEA